MLTGSGIASSLLSSNFSNARIHKAKDKINTDFHAYTLNHQLNKDETKVVTNIVNDLRLAHEEVMFQQFPPLDLESLLLLEFPKPKEEYKVVKAIIPIAAPVKDKEKTASSRTVKSKLTWQEKLKNKRMFSSVSNAYNVDDGITESLMTSEKKIRLNKDDDVDMTTDYSHQQAVPSNLYAVLQQLFEVFWEMDMPLEIRPAFFAKICRANCIDYGLVDYDTKPCSLPTIQTKLASNEYQSIYEFAYDFDKMFDNIFQYYSETHPAYAKAHELRLVWDAALESGKGRFVYTD